MDNYINRCTLDKIWSCHQRARESVQIRVQIGHVTFQHQKIKNRSCSCVKRKLCHQCNNVQPFTPATSHKIKSFGKQYTMIPTIVSSSVRIGTSSLVPSVALVGQRQLSLAASQSASKLNSILEEYRAQK